MTSAEILIGRETTGQHRLCAVCTLHFVHTDILLGVCGITRISIAGYFYVKLKFGSWTLSKVRRAQASPAVLSVKIGLEVGAFSVICQMFATFPRSWWCDFYPYKFEPRLVPLYLNVFFCNLFVLVHLPRCARFLDPALDNIFHYHDRCLSWIIIANRHLQLFDVVV